MKIEAEAITKLSHLTIVPSSLEDKSASNPHGAFHAQVSRGLEGSDGQDYALDAGDVVVDDAELCALARALMHKTAQWIADRSRIAVRVGATRACAKCEPARGLEAVP